MTGYAADMNGVRMLFLGVVVSMLAAVAVADAASVAYIDKGGVWVSSVNGKQKRKVSGKTKDGHRWTELAQADNGRILAVRREPGKISNLNRFTLWGPTGKRIYQGVLGSESGWTSYAYPLSLDLTANGRNVVYGYSAMRYSYPVSQLQEGAYVNYADRTGIYTPFKLTDRKWPTVVKNRIVAGSGDGLISVQKAAGQPPFADEFTPWITLDPQGADVNRADVSASGRLVGVELELRDGGKVLQTGIVMIRTKSLGGAVTGQCVLPTKGLARQVSIAQDGRSVAWQDRRGVVVSGAPVFGGGEACGLKRKAKVISKTATYPSIGKAKVKVKKKRKKRRR